MGVVALHGLEKMPASAVSPARDRCRSTQEHLMQDILMLGLGFGLFALSIGFAYACERL